MSRRFLALGLVMCVFGMMSISAQHLPFLGIPIDGPISQFETKLKAKGFKYTPDFSYGDDSRAYQGDVNGDLCNVNVSFDYDSKKVQYVSIEYLAEGFDEALGYINYRIDKVLEYYVKKGYVLRAHEVVPDKPVEVFIFTKKPGTDDEPDVCLGMLEFDIIDSTLENYYTVRESYNDYINFLKDIGVEY